MRIRIVKQPSGIVDGVDLGELVEGHTYEVSAAVGQLLVVDGEAVIVDDASPVLVPPLNHPIAKRFRAGNHATWDERPEHRTR